MQSYLYGQELQPYRRHNLIVAEATQLTGMFDNFVESKVLSRCCTGAACACSNVSWTNSQCCHHAVASEQGIARWNSPAWLSATPQETCRPDMKYYTVVVIIFFIWQHLLTLGNNVHFHMAPWPGWD